MIRERLHQSIRNNGKFSYEKMLNIISDQEIQLKATMRHHQKDYNQKTDNTVMRMWQKQNSHTIIVDEIMK